MSENRGVGAFETPPVIRLDEASINSLHGWLLKLVKRLNGGLSWGDGAHGTVAGNMDVEEIDYVFGGSANASEQVAHRLGRRPVGFMVVWKDRACDIYDPAASGHENSFNATVMNLASSVANAAVKLKVW